jgi:hypothetical protein
MASRRDITRDIDPDYDGHTVAVAGARALERRADAASYYPKTDPLVPLDHVAAKSNTSVSEAVAIRLDPAWAA